MFTELSFKMSRQLVLLFLVATFSSALMLDKPSKRTSYDEYLGMSLNDPRVLNRKMICPPDCPSDCKELQDMGNLIDGVYIIYISTDSNRARLVYCDMQTSGGGWLVFQRRQTGLEDFYRDWATYELGFGSINGEFWLGNEDLHLLLAEKYYRLRIDMTNYTNSVGYAEYTYFSIGSPLTKYMLTIGAGFTGNEGDSLSGLDGFRFSTYDQDNDVNAGQCAVGRRGAWWFGSCGNSNLNGLYGNNTANNVTTVHWYTWNSDYAPLRFVEMKFRPM